MIFFVNVDLICIFNSIIFNLLSKNGYLILSLKIFI